ncbi:MAG: hypothetical protein ACN4GZ_07945 [Acidimicrobiales bacterium]
MFKKLLIAFAMLAVVTVPAGGASAGPPEDSVVSDYINLFLDADEGKSVWINITALDFCLWARDGFQGPPPVVDDDVPGTLNFTADGGAAVASIKTGGLYIEVWNLDNPEGPFLGACEDILEQLLAGSRPWATGTTSINARTNNLFFPNDYARGVSGGFKGTALLETTEGGDSYRYQFTSHGNSKCDCGVTNTSLRMQ